MRHHFLKTLLIIEIIVITVLVINIYEKRATVASVYPITRRHISFPNNSKLKFFYQNPSDQIITDKPPWLPYTAKYTLNKDGLNDRLDHPINKPSDTFRIITLGDSFTFGLFVNTDDSYPKQLEKKLNERLFCKNFKKVEVINLGVIGYDIQYAVEQYRLKGSVYKPDLVLWFLKDDDFLMINDFLSSKAIEIRGKAGSIFNSSFADQSNWWLNNVSLFNKEWGETKVLNVQKNNLFKMSDYYNGKLVLFSFPQTNIKYKAIMNEYVVSHASSYFFDKLTNIYSLKDSLPDSHPNKDGYKLIADDLYRYLTESKVIPCD